MYSIGDPYIEYTINVTLQQLNFIKDKDENGKKIDPVEEWIDIGHVVVSPKSEGRSIDEKGKGNSSTPRVMNNDVYSYAFISCLLIDSLPHQSIC